MTFLQNILSYSFGDTLEGCYYAWTSKALPSAQNLSSLNGNFSVVAFLAEQYYYYVDELGDERVAGWPLMSSPWPVLIIALTYVGLCSNPPSSLRTSEKTIKPVLALYNMANILINAYIAKELFVSSRQYNITCQPVDYSNASEAIQAASALWWYFILKGFELGDSLFFILRGKYSHLTFLHVYHHSTMFCLWWIGVKYVAGGSAVFGAMINCCVHIVMYSYYSLCLIQSNKGVLWWKQYITMLQMAQFVAAIVMGVNGIRVQCQFPVWMQYAMILYMISFLILFSHFFIRCYVKKQKVE